VDGTDRQGGVTGKSGGGADRNEKGDRVAEGQRQGGPRLPKASDLLADNLRRRVIGEGLAPGDPLPSESDLVAEWGYSRGTVREALRLLESDGLIRIKRGPGGGITVGRPDQSHVARSFALQLSLDQVPLRDLFAFRKLVEPAATALAAEHATDADLAALAAAVSTTAGPPGPQRRPSDRLDLHLIIAEASHNALLKLAYGAIEEIVRWHTDEESLTEIDLEEVAKVHRTIVKAITDRRGPAASKAMLRHLERFEQRMDEQGRLDSPIIPRSRWRQGPLPGDTTASAR